MKKIFVVLSIIVVIVFLLSCKNNSNKKVSLTKENYKDFLEVNLKESSDYSNYNRPKKIVTGFVKSRNSAYIFENAKLEFKIGYETVGTESGQDEQGEVLLDINIERNGSGANEKYITAKSSAVIFIEGYELISVSGTVRKNELD